MNNNQLSMSELDKMVRPRSIYVSSDLIPFDADVSTATYSLQEPVVAQEGFDLVFGVRSFGYNASATNISFRQRNNKLLLRKKYVTPKYIYTASETFVTSPQEEKTVDYYITFPDGLYTIDELFAMLSDPTNYTIPSGYKYDVRFDGQYYIDYTIGNTFNNELFLHLIFTRTDGGFSVRPAIQNKDIINQYTVTGFSGGRYSAENVNDILKSLTILPDPSSPELYNLLFTNRNTDSKNHAGEIPQFETNLQGTNPPTQIIFLITVNLYDTGKTPNQLEPLVTVNPQSGLIFYPVFDPDSNILFELNEKYPASGFLAPYRGARFYHLPNISPLYVDVISDLPTNNVTIEGGQRGVLVRQFALGGNNGGTSFFQNYENPVFFRCSHFKENIDSIRLNFVSEGNKWHFFNLEFFLEILVFEYPKKPLEKPLTSQYDVIENSSTTGKGFYLPPEDEITSSMGHDHNSFPFRHLGNDRSQIHFQDSLDVKFKRSRR